MEYIGNEILLSHRKEWNNAICSNMDGFRDHPTMGSKSERERQILHDITYMWNLKYDTNELIHKTETDSHRKQTWLSKRKGSIEKIN